MTEQTPDATGQTYDPDSSSSPLPPADTSSTPAAPAPAETSSTPAPAPAETSSTPAPAPAETSSTPAPSPAGDASSSSSTSSGPKVGELCTYTIADEAGFETLTACVVLEVFTEPDEDGKDVQLARVGVLPDERIVHADRLHVRS